MLDGRHRRASSSTSKEEITKDSNNVRHSAVPAMTRSELVRSVVPGEQGRA
jgi:hypothetical protein